MAYKVFLVEDEIVTRRGIRNAIDWPAAGFHFCGEAADGEMALPLIQEQRPEIVITDIKMPFMDGLQLSRLLKECVPETKILILSGHDEFKYAQEAIQLGVTEYLLKPISAQQLLAALHKVAQLVAREQQAAAQQCDLTRQLDDYRTMLCERYLLNLVVGNVTATEVLEQGRSLNLDLTAPCYLVLIVRVVPAEQGSAGGSGVFQAADAALAALVAQTEHCSRVKKDLDETILILTGEDGEALRLAAGRLVAQAQQALERSAACHVLVGTSGPTRRLSSLSQAFFHALEQVDAAAEQAAAQARPAPAWRPAALAPDASAVARLLRSGVKSDLDQLFASYCSALDARDGESRLLLSHAMTDAVLSAGSFLRELGGNPAELLPELSQLELMLQEKRDLEIVQPLVRTLVQRVLAYRDEHVHHQHALVTKASAFIDANYADPEISLGVVADHVLLSPGYLSVIFGRELGETFIEYLTGLRVRKAIELLRTTSLTSSEIALQVGYQSPRYFHKVFRKAVGCSPIVFRRQSLER